MSMVLRIIIFVLSIIIFVCVGIFLYADLVKTRREINKRSKEEKKKSVY